MQSGFCCMGPSNHANAAIGSARQLMGRRLFYAIDGISKMGDWRNNLQYNNLTFARQVNNPMIPWESFQVEQGFGRNESVISVCEREGLRQLCGHNIPDEALKVLNNIGPENGALVLLTPLSAKML
jgi:hypothetical protein